MKAAPRPLPSLWAKVMGVALLLMVAAPDHWAVAANAAIGDAHGFERHHSPELEGDGSHERHCHVDAATCSDVPVVGATGLAFLAAWLLLGAPRAGRWLRLPEGTAGPVGETPRVEPRPPRQARAGS